MEALEFDADVRGVKRQITGRGSASRACSRAATSEVKVAAVPVRTDLVRSVGEAGLRHPLGETLLPPKQPGPHRHEADAHHGQRQQMAGNRRQARAVDHDRPRRVDDVRQRCQLCALL